MLSDIDLKRYVEFGPDTEYHVYFNRNFREGKSSYPIINHISESLHTDKCYCATDMTKRPRFSDEYKITIRRINFVGDPQERYSASHHIDNTTLEQSILEMFKQLNPNIVGIFEKRQYEGMYWYDFKQAIKGASNKVWYVLMNNPAEFVKHNNTDEPAIVQANLVTVYENLLKRSLLNRMRSVGILSEHDEPRIKLSNEDTNTIKLEARVSRELWNAMCEVCKVAVAQALYEYNDGAIVKFCQAYKVSPSDFIDQITGSMSYSLGAGAYSLPLKIGGNTHD